MENVRKMREQAGLTMKQAAMQAGISESHFCLIENGARRPSVETAKKIASVLGFDWRMFFPDEPRAG